MQGKCVVDNVSCIQLILLCREGEGRKGKRLILKKSHGLSEVRSVWKVKAGCGARAAVRRPPLPCSPPSKCVSLLCIDSITSSIKRDSNSDEGRYRRNEREET